jgi:hypothetical protein
VRRQETREPSSERVLKRHTLSRAGVLFTLPSLVLLGACGSNTPQIPPELLDTNGGCRVPSYVSGPYGREEGNAVKNFCFRGWRNPTAIAHTEANLEIVAFSDYYDPQGTKGTRLLIVNTAALWCSACQEEHKKLPAQFTDYSKRGLAIIATLFQDNRRNPATPQDLGLWADTFDTNFPLALDPDYQMGEYASAETAPLNLLIDTRNMTILKKIIGDQPTVLWPFIEQKLSGPASSQAATL